MMNPLGPEWHISPPGISIITENGNLKDPRKILDLALNSDLKVICNPGLANGSPKDTLSKIVLQIQKIRNISAPKANEDSQAAPRMLKLSLTDGESVVQAIEFSSLNSISRAHTPPGSKVLINNAKVVSGYLLLTASNCTLLGGKVPHLIEKWELTKSINRQQRNSSEDGPPPWVSFGKKVQSDVQKNVPSLEKSKESKDNTEFELQRQGAIAEATSGASRKVFGGRVKQNVQDSASNNNRNSDRREQVKNKHRNAVKEKDVEEKPLKPSEKVSLFSYLENKLPLPEPSKSARQPGGTNNSYNRDNNGYKYTTHKASVNSKNNFENSEKYYHQNGNVSNMKNSGYSTKIQETTKVSRENDNISSNQPKLLQNDSNSYPKQSYRENKFENHNRRPYEYNKNGVESSSFNSTSRSSSINHNPVQNVTKQNDKPYNNYQKPNNKNNYYLNANSSKTSQSNQKYERFQYNNDKRDERQSSHESHSNWKQNYDHNATKQMLSDPTSQDDGAKFGNSTNQPKNEISDLTQNMEKISVNSQFASRSLRQHLNLGVGKKPEDPVKEKESGIAEKSTEKQLWHVGDEILARYWEDGKFYNATVTAVTEKTYAVMFKGYGNIEEILKHDCLPLPENTSKSNNSSRQNRQYGSMEFRRSNRNYNNYN